MKKTAILLAAIGLPISVFANVLPQVASRESSSLHRNGDYMEVSVDMDFTNLKVKSTQAVVFTPQIVNGADTLNLSSIGVYGRRRFIDDQRAGVMPMTGKSETVFKAKEAPQTYGYTALVPYADWMNGAELRMATNVYGCCNAATPGSFGPLDTYEIFTPGYMYVQPKGDAEKSRSLSGKAFVDFPVNQTIIYPEYRNNTVELGKITATIDSVRSDKDVTIREVWLKGFASPESPYSHNTMLAKGRVAALKTHVQNLIHLPSGVVTTDYEPEDWEGLRRFVESSNIEHRDEILAMINSDMEPDAKEKKIKTTYPEQYQFMLRNWYPALRHTDYRIDYTVRSFYDPKEIAEVMKREPGKLSLNEFYVLSNSYEPGSDEFNEVFETAVRMFPTDETANLNAALNAMQRGDMAKAESYLQKAGESPEADYARGLYFMNLQQPTDALPYLQRAAKAGIAGAEEALQYIDRNS